MTKFWVDEAGKILRATDDSAMSFPGAVEAITKPPVSGRQTWDFATKTWGGVPARIVPPGLQDTPGSANSVPALRDELNALKAHLRGQR